MRARSCPLNSLMIPTVASRRVPSRTDHFALPQRSIHPRGIVLSSTRRLPEERRRLPRYLGSMLSYGVLIPSLLNRTLTLVVKASQLTGGFDTQCQYANGTVQTINGVDFTIFCGEDEAGYNDFCTPYTLCNEHKESLADCMEYCTELHPLCTGVSWNSDLIAGYGNCYPKLGWPDRGLSIAQGDNSTGAGMWVHTAVASIKNGSSIPYSCAPQEHISASNSKTFVISCNSNMTDSTMTYSHQNSLDDCIDTCATWHDGSCVGVSWDATLTKGWENCYLINATSTLQKADNVTLALLPGGAATTTHKTSSQTSHTGAIVGGVIGGTVGLVAIAAAVWFMGFKKTRRTSEKSVYDKSNSPPHVSELETNEHCAEMDGHSLKANPVELEALIRE
jgi:hypothetical protein